MACVVRFGDRTSYYISYLERNHKESTKDLKLSKSSVSSSFPDLASSIAAMVVTLGSQYNVAVSISVICISLYADIL